MRHYNNNGHRSSFGTIERKGSGKFMARFWITDLQGRKFRKSKMLQADNIEDARKELVALTKINALESTENALLKLKAQLEGVKAEREAFIESQPAMKLDEIFDAYLETRQGRKASAATKQTYEYEFNRFIRFMKNNFPTITEARQITLFHTRAFSDYLIKTTMPSHNRYISLLKAIWDSVRMKEEEESMGVKDFNGLIDIGNGKPKARLPTENPWDGVGSIEFTPCNRRDLTLDEIKKVLLSTDGEMQMLWMVGISTGLRLHDACNLEWNQIDMTQGFINLTPHKTARHGTKIVIPMLPELYRALSSVPENQRHGYVMPEIQARYEHSSAALSYHIQKVLKQCGIETQGEGFGGRKCVKVGYHSCRHGFVSLAQQYGIPMTTIQAIVGHTSVAMTEHYLHINPLMLQSQMKAFPRLLDNAHSQPSDLATSPSSSSME